MSDAEEAAPRPNEENGDEWEEGLVQELDDILEESII